jgi:hypothetical protein
MNQEESKSRIKKEIDLFEKENKKMEIINEDYKNKLSEQIRLIDPKEIKNSDLIKKKYSIWERIIRTLGKN